MGYLLFSGFALSFVGAFLFTPISIRLARIFNVFDQPGKRKIHLRPVPRWGGLGIFAGVLLALGCLNLWSDTFAWLLGFKGVIKSGGEIVGTLSLDKQLAGILFGGSLVLALGLIDDKRGVSAAVKLPVQIIASYVAMDYGVRISGLTLPWMGPVHFPLWISQLVTVLWIVGFMNTINLVDGLDGLAAGLVVIASGTFLVLSMLLWDSKIVLLAKEMKMAAVLSSVLCGATLAFLFYNFFPARTFMGDSGALFLGFMLGAITAIGTLKTAAVIAFLIPLIVVAVPILDVIIAVVRRWRRHSGLMTPDREHFHHRLLSWGWTQREAVLLVYVFTLVFSIVAIVLTVFKAQV